MKISELSVALSEVSVQLTKAQDEILARIAVLEASLLDVELPEAAIVALDNLRTGAQLLDDIVPDTDLGL